MNTVIKLIPNDAMTMNDAEIMFEWRSNQRPFTTLNMTSVTPLTTARVP